MQTSAITFESVANQRRVVSSAGNGERHWRTDYLGVRGQKNDAPEAFLIEMSANETLLPHYHAVDQFQVFVAGNGTLGKHSAAPLIVHYADHHTGYGPIVASPCGLSYFTFRPMTDPGAVYLNNPKYRELLAPSAKRHATSAPASLSIQPVLSSRTVAAVEKLLPGFEPDDGVGAYLYRLGPDMQASGPPPARTGGQYYLVANGALVHGKAHLGQRAVVYVPSAASAFSLQSGSHGAEVVLLEFPNRQAA